MNPEYTEYRFPQIKPLPWEKVFRHRTPREAIDFVSRLLGYDPSKRPRPLEALLDPYFDELRDQNTRLPNGQPMPNLFGFTEGKCDVDYLSSPLQPTTVSNLFQFRFSTEEMTDEPEVCPQLIPEWYRQQNNLP